MTNEEFDRQIMRLAEQYGAKAYTGERLKFIRLDVIRERGDVFERAVTRLIKTKRAAPLVLDISEAIGAIHAEDKQRERESYPQFNGVGGALSYAAKRTNADKDFVRACIETLDAFTSKKITREAFLQQCSELARVADQINPEGRERAL